MPVELHLMIAAAQELQTAARQPATEIPSAVHPRGWRWIERIREESFRSEGGAVQVAASQAEPPEIKLSSGTDRCRL